MTNLRNRIIRKGREDVVNLLKKTIAPASKINYTRKEEPKKFYIPSSKPKAQAPEKDYTWGAHYKNGYRLKK